MIGPLSDTALPVTARVAVSGERERAGSGVDGAASAVPAVARMLDENAPLLIEQLSEWVRIPSVASDPQRQLDVIRSAHWLAGTMRAVGLDTTLYRTGDSMAVYGEWLVDPALPTVLVYSHHDVRHAKPEEWKETEPFAPVLRDGRLFGRGASDAKAQVIAHLWGLRAHLAATGRDRPAVNLKFLIEGEEENGSPHLASLLEENSDKFRCDVIVFSDTIQWKKDSPGLVTSMRGMVSASVTIAGPSRDVHSGVASGAAPNPSRVLADLLTTLHDEDGRIALPGFYDGVVPPSDARRGELADLPFDEATWIERTETRSAVGEPEYDVKERLWLRPSLEVLSLLAGDPEGIARAVIPATAEATLSIRTVPDQIVGEVATQLRTHVEQHLPDTVTWELEIDEETGQEPYVTPEGPALDALHRAIAAGFGQDCVGRMGNAGGGPAELLATSLNVDVILLGTGLPEDHWHASDESVDIGMLLGGAASIAHLWDELGRLSSGDFS